MSIVAEYSGGYIPPTPFPLSTDHAFSTPSINFPRLYHDPEYFGKCVLGVEESHQQRQVSQAVVDGEKFIAVRSGTGTGKTWKIGEMILWFLGTRRSCKGLVTSTKEDQIKGQVWQEVHNLLASAPQVWKDNIVITDDKPQQIDVSLKEFLPTHILIEYSYYFKIARHIRIIFPNCFLAIRANNIEPLQHFDNYGIRRPPKGRSREP